jgi:hypothetical protein
MSIIETYTGFFTPRPFWAIEAIDFEDPTSGGLQRFHSLMSEFTYQYDSNTFSFRVCRDGMLLLRVHETETKVRNDIHELVEWWGEYLDYLNCLYLLIDSELINVTRIQHFNFSELRRHDIFRATVENIKKLVHQLPPRVLQAFTNIYITQDSLMVSHQVMIHALNIVSLYPKRYLRK